MAFPLEIELTDVITPKSCSSLIAELIKYIVYNKQQIPYPYERLKMFVLKRRERQNLVEVSNSTLDHASSVRVAFLMEKYYKKVEEAFETLDSTFKCIEQKLIESKEHPIEEIVLLFGATLVSPKDIYRIRIPSLSYGHADGQHLWKRQIGNLFRRIIVSDEVNSNLQHRVGLTNMFVMMKVKKAGYTYHKWLLPKDHYRLSECTQQVCFSFSSLTSKLCNCSPEDNQFEMVSQHLADLKVSDHKIMPCEEDIDCDSPTFEPDDQFIWFQTTRSLRGFRDCKLKGKSVTDLWYRHNFIS